MGFRWVFISSINILSMISREYIAQRAEQNVWTKNENMFSFTHSAKRVKQSVLTNSRKNSMEDTQCVKLTKFGPYTMYMYKYRPVRKRNILGRGSIKCERSEPNFGIRGCYSGEIPYNLPFKLSENTSSKHNSPWNRGKGLLLKKDVTGKFLKKSFNYRNGFMPSNLLGSHKMTEFWKLHCDPGHQFYCKTNVNKASR